MSLKDFLLQFLKGEGEQGRSLTTGEKKCPDYIKKKIKKMIHGIQVGYPTALGESSQDSISEHMKEKQLIGSSQH